MHRSRACLRDIEGSCPRARYRSSQAAYRPGNGRRRWSNHIQVAPREGAIVALRLVKHGDVRRDVLLDQPVQHRSHPVSGISDKPLRLETKALFGPFNHGLCCAYLGLANGARSLDINDDTELHVDEIVVGVREECRPLVGDGPLRRWIGRRDELRDNVAGRAPRRIVEGCQILLHRAT